MAFFNLQYCVLFWWIKSQRSQIEWWQQYWILGKWWCPAFEKKNLISLKCLKEFYKLINRSVKDLMCMCVCFVFNPLLCFSLSTSSFVYLILDFEQHLKIWASPSFQAHYLCFFSLFDDIFWLLILYFWPFYSGLILNTSLFVVQDLNLFIQNLKF